MNYQKVAELATLSNEELYLHYIDGDVERSPEVVIEAYHNLGDALNEYINALSESSFAEGFHYAVSLIKGNTVA